VGLVDAGGRGVPSGLGGDTGRLGHEIRFRARLEARRRVAQAARDASQSADAAAAAAAKARRQTGQTRRMRFLRPDLLSWSIVIPLLVASWSIHARLRRRFQQRTAIDRRFAPLSRRS